MLRSHSKTHESSGSDKPVEGRGVREEADAITCLILFGGRLLFTKAPTIRTWTCNGLRFLGIELNEKRNAANAGVISTDSSRVPPRVIRTDEEYTTAEAVCRVLSLNEKREN